MSQGVLAKAGWAAGTAWDQAFVQATTLLPFSSESIARTYQQLKSQALIGQAGAHEFEHGVVGNAGEIPLELDYNNLGLLEYAMGAVSSGVYTFVNDLDKWFHTEIDKVVERYRYAGCIINAFTLSADAASENPVMFTPTITARSLAHSATAIGSLTDTPARAYWPHFSAGYIRIADTADALASGDNRTIKSWEISVDNNLQLDLIDSDSGSYYQKPIRNGFRTVELKVDFGRFNPDAIALRDLFLADTRLQAELFLTNTAGTIKIEIPLMKVKAGMDFNIGGPAVLEDSVTFECFYNGTKNASMSVTDQMQITVT